MRQASALMLVLLALALIMRVEAAPEAIALGAIPGSLRPQGGDLTPGPTVPDVGGIRLTNPAVVIIENATLRAPDGTRGITAERVGPAHGGNGGRGGDIIIDAPEIVLRNVTLLAGRGGRGGDAISYGSPHAFAAGGDGGPGGRVILRGHVSGENWVIRDGDGGDGGTAIARGRDADCEGRQGTTPPVASGDDGTPVAPDGKKAEATGGDGGCGPWDGVGGAGGDSRAFGGNGSFSAGGTGGRGGDAFAFAGRGGDGLDACFATNDEAARSGVKRAGTGGPGGQTLAQGGRGGDSTLRGGDGGNAYGFTAYGNGGNATPPIEYGQVALRSPDPSFGVHGGDGGTGNTGGNGGTAKLDFMSGNAGTLCGPLPVRTIPGVPEAAVLATLAIVAEGRRREPLRPAGSR